MAILLAKYWQHLCSCCSWNWGWMLDGDVYLYTIFMNDTQCYRFTYVWHVQCSQLNPCLIQQQQRQQHQPTLRTWIKRLNAFYIIIMSAAENNGSTTQYSTIQQQLNSIYELRWQQQQQQLCHWCTPININWTQSYKIEWGLFFTIFFFGLKLYAFTSFSFDNLKFNRTARVRSCQYSSYNIKCVCSHLLVLQFVYNFVSKTRRKKYRKSQKRQALSTQDDGKNSFSLPKNFGKRTFVLDWIASHCIALHIDVHSVQCTLAVAFTVFVLYWFFLLRFWCCRAQMPNT